MKKLILLNSILILSFINIFAQIDIKEYLDYEYPDLKRHELTFDLDFSNETVSNKYNDTLYNDYYRSYFESPLAGEYTFTKITRKYIGTHWVSLNNDLQFTKHKENVYTQYKRFQNDIYIGVGSNNIFYMKNKWFYGLSFSSGYDLFFSNLYSNPYDESNFAHTYNRQNRLALSSGLAFGKGRIEDITDVIHAIRLAENLKKMNKIDDYPSSEKIKELSQFMAKLKNKRFFDSRHKKIYELEQIDSILSANKIINNSDIKYFTILEDIWVYGGIFERGYGSELKFSIGSHYHKDLNPDFNGLDIQEIYIHMNPNVDVYITPGISYKNTKPISVKKHSTFQASIGYDLTFSRYKSGAIQSALYNSGGFKNIRSNVSYEFGYYPNTRTFLETGIGLLYSNYVLFDIYENYNSNLQNPISASILIKSYYYLSPQVRLYINANLNYAYKKNNYYKFNSKNFWLKLSGGLQISLK